MALTNWLPPRSDPVRVLEVFSPDPGPTISESIALIASILRYVAHRMCTTRSRERVGGGMPFRGVRSEMNMRTLFGLLALLLVNYETVYEQTEPEQQPKSHRLPRESAEAVERFEPRQATFPELSREDADRRPWLKPGGTLASRRAARRRSGMENVSVVIEAFRMLSRTPRTPWTPTPACAPMTPNSWASWSDTRTATLDRTTDSQ
jgi:hypothetical protein